MIGNVEIMGLESSIKASKYPMSTNIELLDSSITQTGQLLTTYANAKRWELAK